MSDIIRKRHLRPWLWRLAAMMALLVGGAVAWWYRPLSAVEARLVGTWRSDRGSEFTFCRDHSYRADLLNARGTWSAAESRLRMRDVPRGTTLWETALVYWQALTHPKDWTCEMPIEFEGPDRFRTPAEADEFRGFSAGYETFVRVD